MGLLSLLIVVIIIFAMIVPVLTTSGYLNLEKEPERHDISSKLLPIPFVLLAIANALGNGTYIQAGASLVVAVILFMSREKYDQEERLEGKYIQMFLYLAALYFLSSASSGGSGAIVTAVGGALAIGAAGFFIPAVFRELAPIGENYEAPIIGGNNRPEIEVNLNAENNVARTIPAPSPNPNINPNQFTLPKVSNLDISDEDINNEPMTSSTPKPVSSPITPATASPVNDPEPAPVAPPPTTPVQQAPAPVTPQPVPQQQSSIDNVQQSTPQPPVGNTGENIAATPAVKKTVKRVYKPVDIFELVGGKEIPRERQESNLDVLDETDEKLLELRELSKNKSATEKPVNPAIAKLPPRTLKADPFKTDKKVEDLKTEQPRHKTSGIGFDINNPPK